MEAREKTKTLQRQIHDILCYRDYKISSLRRISGLEALLEITRHTELLASDLRAALIGFYDEMQALGCCLPEQPVPNAPGINVQVQDKAVHITLDGMLPYPIKGSARCLHEKLDAALSCYTKKNALPRPLFRKRCAVVFIHHYEENGKAIRNMRDYDNTERRCITNVIARHFLRDDSPACYISMDMLAPGDSCFTEIRLLTIPAFRALVRSGEIEYFPKGNVSKKAPKMYQKT